MSTANIRSSRRRFLAQAVGAGASLCAFNACSDELATSSGSEPAGPVPVPSDTTVVTLTGTGIPHPAPGRAGSGTLVRWGDIALQFDAGRGTVIRLEEAGASPYSLSAQFVTHVHSDHVVDLVDVAMTRWIQQQLHRTGPLVVVADERAAATFVGRMFDPFEEDIAIRTSGGVFPPPTVDLRTFEATRDPTHVWASDDGNVAVEAVAVRHTRVADAVGYRVTTPAGVIVISGDTTVCDEIEELATDCDLMVHEACRAEFHDAVEGTPLERAVNNHANTNDLGALAQRARVPHVVLTHLIPQPANADDERAFTDELRAGGYEGEITVGRDLTTVEVSRLPQTGGAQRSG